MSALVNGDRLSPRAVCDLDSEGAYRTRVLCAGGRPPRETYRAELASLETAYRDWSLRAQVWLDENARTADAAVFEQAIGPSEEILGSFDRAHNHLRLRLSWQLNVLRELPRDA
jgi:hypothetical protein